MRRIMERSFVGHVVCDLSENETPLQMSRAFFWQVPPERPHGVESTEYPRAKTFAADP